MEELKASKVKEQLDIIWRPHPVAPLADCQYKTQEWKSGQTVREILIANGIDQHQPISIILDDRLLSVDEWDTVCPNPNQIINVKAEVAGGGGGGGSNVLQIVALIALIIVVVVLQQYELLPAIGGLSAGASAGVYIAAGSIIINGVAAMMQSNSMSMNDSGGMGGSYSQASPTYSLTGGSNRLRPYESMPVIMGQMRFFPDSAVKPYTEYIGEDQYLRQVFHLGLSGATFANWEIGTTPITSYSDYAWSYPDPNGKINAFPGNVDTISGAALEYSAGWINRTTSLNTDQIGIDIEGTLYYANNSGSLDSTSVFIEIEYKATLSGTWIQPTQLTAQGNGFAVGDWQNYQVWVESGYWGNTWFYNEEYGYWQDGWGWVDTSHYETRTRFAAGTGNMLQLSGASQSPRRVTVLLDVTPGEYDVRVRRVTGDSTDSRLQNKTNWSVMKSYQTDTASYVGQNRIGISIRASEQLNGVIQQMSVTASAKANYYNGSAWVYAETSNPAHWFMDFVLGRKDKNGNLMYGVGLPTSQIDYVGLAAWASFCATEGLTFNSVLDGQQTAADVINGIARAGFASPSWASGKLGAVWDKRNASPVAAFGMSNIIKGSFQVSYITEQLAEEIVVRYVNPNKDWNQDEVRVNVPGVTNPTRTSSIDLWGCTSTSMAGKFANYIAAQQYYRTRRITWDCDFEGFVCSRGDVVILSHDLTQWGYSGRPVSVDGNVITLDRAVPRNGSAEYLMLKDPDGTMTTYTVLADTGEHNQITLASTPDFQNGYLPLDHVWFFSPLETPGKKVKILSVQPVSESRVQIVATDEYPEFYSAWDGTWVEPANSSLLQKPQVPVISDIKFTEQLALVGTGRIMTRVNISWTQKTSQCERVDVTYKLGSNASKTITVYSATDIDVDFDGYGTITATALPINGTNVGVAISGSGYVYGKTLPPTTPTGLSATVSGTRILVDWTNNPELDLAGYEVRTTDSGWGSSGFLFKGSASQCYANAPAIGSSSTWYVKAYDTSGLYSSNSANVTFTPESVPNISSANSSFYDTSTTSAYVTLDWSDAEPQFGLSHYEITYTPSGGTQILTNIKTTMVTFKADWTGNRSFLIKTVDNLGNKSSGYTKTVSKALPAVPASGSSRVDNGSLSLDWVDSVKTTLPVWGYEVRNDTNFNTPGFVFKGVASQCTVDTSGLLVGSNAFYVKAIDTDYNYSYTYLTITHAYADIPNVTSITSSFGGTSTTSATAIIKWVDADPQYGLLGYEITSNADAPITVTANSVTVPASWVGSKTFTIKTIDVNGNKSSGITHAINITVPVAPASGTSRVNNGILSVEWIDSVKTSLPISSYEVRKDTNFGTSGFSFKGSATQSAVDVSGISVGINTFYVKSIDTNGNYSSNYLTITHTYQTISNPLTITSYFADTSLTAATITLSWSDVVPQYGIKYYELTYGSLTKNVNSNTITVDANWIGNRDFTVKTVDANGNKSSGKVLSVEKLVPNSPLNFRPQVIDNTVMLYWSLPTKTSLPISHALLKKGATWATATLIGEKAGEFTTVNESHGGEFTYWMAMVDTDGYESTPVSVTTKVSEPPDFIFYGSFDSTFGGTFTNAKLDAGKIVLPINLTETWTTHFTSRTWSTPQDQITAGYPIYIQPGLLAGSYMETFDFGTLLASSKVSLSYNINTIAGTPTVTPKIELSPDNSTWTVFDGMSEVFSTNFRYVRVTITVTGTATAIAEIVSINIRADAKQITDAGQVAALSTDVNGTIANFNKTFIDVDAITVTASGTTALTAVYDFKDTILSGTYAVVSNVLTVTVSTHGLIAGQKVRIAASTGTLPIQVVTIATATTNSFTATVSNANTSGNVSIYPESFRIYIFNSTTGARVSGTASWNVRGY